MPNRELLTASNARGRSGLSRRDVLAKAALVGAAIAIGPTWFSPESIAANVPVI